MAKKSESIFEMFSAPVLEAIENSDLSEGQIEKLIEQLIEEGHKDLFESLKSAAPDMLEEEAALRTGFERRHYLRWKEPLDLLMMLFRMCSEIGEAHSHEGPGDSNLLLFDTLALLHPRGLLVTSEIQCLLRGGFADAALARWRTLHELAVVTKFIAKHGHRAALAYRLSFVFASERAARQYNEYSERANLEPFPDIELSDMVAQCDLAEQQLGRRLRGDWGWAAEFLGKESPTFFDLERNVGMDHWRPRVKWASQHTHAGFMEPLGTLGMSEAEKLMLQVGPSNSGLVDPIHMTAISLANLTVTFLLSSELDFDRAIMTKVLQAVVDEIGETAVISGRRTASDLDQQQ